ncbi:MAG: tandem-95 repeat protein [Pirellulaceae bacterium]
MTYTPDANFNGTDSFTFVANDGSADSATGTITINVTAVNDAPVADSQALPAAQGISRTVTLTADDVDNDPLAFTVLTQPANGTLTGTAPNLVYTPNAGFTGADSITFLVNDGTVDSNTATISFDVRSTNDPPVANTDGLRDGRCDRISRLVRQRSRQRSADVRDRNSARERHGQRSFEQQRRDRSYTASHQILTASIRVYFRSRRWHGELGRSDGDRLASRQ